MCIPGKNGATVSPQSGGFAIPASSPGAQLDQAQRNAAAAAGGGTRKNEFAATILSGMPRNTDIDAIRKNVFQSV